jgi:serine/threonine-protein kinase
VRRDDCPSDDVLAAFHHGDLPEALLDSVRAHQESCLACELRAQRLDDHVDAVIRDLRTSLEWIGPARSDGGQAPSGAGRTAHHDEEPERAGEDRLDLPDYEVDPSPLGEGGMGVVFRARHLKLDRVVAIKVISARSRLAREFFETEARAVAQLQHPNIVQIFEIGQHEGRPYLSLEFVEGGTLESKIAGGPLPPREAAELVRTLASAVEHAHRRGIVHCDLKPSNILIDGQGSPKIADFGVARWLGPEGLRSPDGHVVGTPRYMAPEQASGEADRVGPAADIFSLGVILHEMLTGRAPHSTAGPSEAPVPGREQPPEGPRRPRPDLPRDLAAIIRTCLREDAADRYPTAEALADDLGRSLRGLPIAAHPLGPLTAGLSLARRHRAAVGLIAVSALWLSSFAILPSSGLLTPRGHRAGADGGSMPNELPGNHPRTVLQGPDGSIRLEASTASIFGNSLVVEAPFGNLGYWHTGRDRAVWTFEIDRPATFAISLEYACPDRFAGNAYEVRLDDARLPGTVAGTGSWSDYRAFSMGAVPLRAGTHRLEVRPAEPIRNALFDLRAVALTPAPATATVAASRP